MHLLNILCFLSLVGVSTSISCYKCSYVMSGKTEYDDTSNGYYTECGNEQDQSYDNIPTVDCPGHCYKTLAKSDDDDLLCVQRGCYNTTAASADSCPAEQATYGILCGLPSDSLTYVLADRVCCDTDQCNSASVITSSLLSPILLLILTIY